MGDGMEEKVPPLCSPPPVRDGKGEELGWLRSVGRGDIEGSARDVKVGALNFVADEQSEAPELCVGAPDCVADPLARAVPLATGGGVSERVESEVWVGLLLCDTGCETKEVGEAVALQLLSPVPHAVLVGLGVKEGAAAVEKEGSGETEDFND